jgi:hypothetical protein
VKDSVRKARPEATTKEEPAAAAAAAEGEAAPEDDAADAELEDDCISKICRTSYLFARSASWRADCELLSLVAFRGFVP